MMNKNKPEDMMKYKVLAFDIDGTLTNCVRR